MKKIALLILAVLLLFPSAVSFAHIFAQHEHKVCSKHTVHIHQKNFECELFKFKPSPIFTTDFIEFRSDFVASPDAFYPETYQFLSDYQKLAFALRGPPTI
ncbi:MAG TPA: hypothetical protein VFM70_01770 [Salinimicrobium sp.]|nr:hypothetical protein [Salinimicrobium sp.]